MEPNRFRTPILSSALILILGLTVLAGAAARAGDGAPSGQGLHRELLQAAEGFRLAVNPNDRDEIVAAASTWDRMGRDCGDFGLPAVFSSADGGRTWSHSCLPNAEVHRLSSLCAGLGGAAFGSSPTLTWNGQDGVFLEYSLSCRVGAEDLRTAAVVAGSADGGATWTVRGTAAGIWRTPSGAVDFASGGSGTVVKLFDWVLRPWPYIYIYDGCPGPLMVAEGTEDVIVRVTLSGETESGDAVELAFDVESGPRYGEADLDGNVLTYHTDQMLDDQVVLTVTDGSEFNQAVVQFDFGGEGRGSAVGSCVEVE